jgi:hypothetical protein
MPWNYPILETMTKANQNPFTSTIFDVSNCQIVSNRLQLGNPAVDGFITSKDPVTTPTDFEVRFVIGALPDGSSFVLLGQLQPNFDSYRVVIYGVSVNIGTIRVAQVVNGAFTWLSDGAGILLYPGYEVGMRKSAGILTAYVNDDWAAAGYQQGSATASLPSGAMGIYLGALPSGSPSIYNVGGGPLPSPVPPGGPAEQDRGEFRGQLRGQLVGSP